MAQEILVGLGILAAAVVAAWLLARKSRARSRRKVAHCPHCGAPTPQSCATCPACSREIRLCPTCEAPILESEGSCEVCGESLRKHPPPVCLCPRCGTRIEGGSRSCPKCGEEFWSPIVAHK
ncbi:MAG: zinc-ribbon domain-containing protein [Thermoplasmatota archaeon]